MAMKVELGRQVALVTGAGRGMGRAIADTLTANGARHLRRCGHGLRYGWRMGLSQRQAHGRGCGR